MANQLLGLLSCDSELLLNHAQGYGLLVQEEWHEQLNVLRRTSWMSAALLSCLTVGATLAGMVCLVWLSHAFLDSRTLIAMAGVVVAPLAGAGFFLVQLRRQPKRDLFDRLQTQLKADYAAFKSSPKP
jgi:hypothetical protein